MHKSKKFLKLRYWREYLGLDQQDLAVLLGCLRSTYCEKENGNIRFYLQECITIQEALNKKLKKMGQDELTLDEIFLR